jgi:guanyl-specific ribonuclease Sa
VVVPPGKGTVFVTWRLKTALSGSWFVTVKVQVTRLPGAAEMGQVLVAPNPAVCCPGVAVGVGVEGVPARAADAIARSNDAKRTVLLIARGPPFWIDRDGIETK